MDAVKLSFPFLNVSTRCQQRAGPGVQREPLPSSLAPAASPCCARPCHLVVQEQLHTRYRRNLRPSWQAGVALAQQMCQVFVENARLRLTSLKRFTCWPADHPEPNG
jgi:hypothetical protein